MPEDVFALKKVPSILLLNVLTLVYGMMNYLQGPVVCPSVHQKQEGVHGVPAVNGNGSMAESFNENDSDYVDSSVVEAVEGKNNPDGFMIKMRDGRHLRCAHNNPQSSPSS